MAPNIAPISMRIITVTSFIFFVFVAHDALMKKARLLTLCEQGRILPEIQ